MYIAIALTFSSTIIIVKLLSDKKDLEKLEDFKIKKDRELEMIFLIRTLGGGMVVEVVSYASGLFKIGYKNFLIGTVLSHMLVVIPAYYFFGNIFAGKNILISIASMGVLILLFTKFKKRYFE